MFVSLPRALGASFLLAFLTSANPAAAHATLETGKAPIGSFYKAVMRVPHGCSGSPTIRVRIRIPEGFIGVKPMPKPGWSLETTKGKYDKPHQLFRASLTEGVREISWSGGRLPDDQYDEFVFTGTIAADANPGDILWFPTVQDCETGAERWIETPAAGQGHDALKSPAPGLMLTPAAP
jgi:periplasmic copper chaperone A